VALTRYGNLIDNFVSTGLDGAFFGSFTYVLAHTRLGLELIARPEYLTGKSTYCGLLLTRKDSGIATIEEMKGKRFAFVDKGTMAGYLFPLRYFKDHGVDNYQEYLGEVYFTGSHSAAVQDVLDNRTDLGVVKDTVLDRMVAAEPQIADNLVVLARSPYVPENAFAVRSDIDSSVKLKMKKALLEMHADPAGMKVLETFGARKFIETREADYQPVYDYAKAIGLDISTYNY
jgi:phosphonate transport system substrate-binding protein